MSTATNAVVSRGESPHPTGLKVTCAHVSLYSLDPPIALANSVGRVTGQGLGWLITR